MKRLFFSDLHLHNWSYGATVTNEGVNSRLWAQRSVIRAMVDDAVKEEIKYAYFCGDLMHVHGTLHTHTLAVAAEMFNWLRAAGIKVRAIPGNHDMVSRHGAYHALSWLPEEEISGRWEDDGLLVSALPYTENPEVLERFLKRAEQVGGVLMLHQGVQGVPLSSGYVLDEVLTPEMIPSNCRAFTGHYHYHRMVGHNLTVVGNLTPLNFSDIDQPKGWVIWDDKTGTIEQRVQTSAPNFVTFYEGNAPEVAMGNFVRYMTPVKIKQIDKIRKDLIGKGALTVEFPEVVTDKKKDKIRTGDDLTIEHIVESFTNANMPARRRKVGADIREESYEGPSN